MVELTSRQRRALERLIGQGFQVIAISPYESALCVRLQNCAALLRPSEGAGLRLMAPPSFLIDGNLSVKIARQGREWFIWKKKEIEATPGRKAELERFRERLEELLQEET